jgi:hypothetical protein
MIRSVNAGLELAKRGSGTFKSPLVDWQLITIQYTVPLLTRLMVRVARSFNCDIFSCISHLIFHTVAQPGTDISLHGLQ